MTCKDCIHFEACKGMLEAQGYHVSDDHVYGENRICETYQNKDSLVPRTEIEEIFRDIGTKLVCTNDDDYEVFVELKKKYGVI